MTAERRRPHWKRVEQVVRLLIGIADAIAEVIDALSRIH
jgi:hypothetical protein